MNSLTFIAEIVKAVAWPATVLVAIYLFRDSLGSLIPRIEKLRHKDTEIDFTRQVEALRSEAPASIKPDSLSQPAKQEFDRDLSLVRNLAEVSPRSAVIEAFRLLETAALIAISKNYPGLEMKGLLSSTEIAQALKEKGLFTDEDAKFYTDLRRLRNQAAHGADFSLSPSAASGYAEIALALAYSLRTK